VSAYSFANRYTKMSIMSALLIVKLLYFYQFDRP